MTISVSGGARTMQAHDTTKGGVDNKDDDGGFDQR